MKKLLILSTLLIVSANAYDCVRKGSDGSLFSTMHETYNESGREKSMWFKWGKKVKGKITETGKQKIEVQNDRFRTLQAIAYDKNGNVKSTYNNGKYSEYEDPIPETIGLWMLNIIKAGDYLKEKRHPKIKDAWCDFLGDGNLPMDENGTIIPPDIQ